MNTIAELRSSLPQVGRVAWIGLSPAPRAELNPVEQVAARVGTGLDGDHHARSGKSNREVTLIQQEHLGVVAALLGINRVAPEWIRRNIVVAGINLAALAKARFEIGDVLLEGTGPCAPCSRMEENLGTGGYNAMRGHGGITARVLRGGTIRHGDAVRFIELTQLAADRGGQLA
ncbi:MAG: MOSC domain-containing protein [Pirellulales bacterium]